MKTTVNLKTGKKVTGVVLPEDIQISTADTEKNRVSGIHAKLKEIDKQSIRGIREFILQKFKTDQAVPQELIDLDNNAKAERTKLK